MNARVRELAVERRITRLCHLTPSSNLVHIATEGEGLLSTKHLGDRHRKVFNRQDLERLDGYPDHICCSIEYPNAWYLRRRRMDPRSESRLFKDWVVLSISLDYLWQDQTLFCPRNAAAQHGYLVSSGAEAFKGMYALAVPGAYEEIRRRVEPPHLRACPTDDQAEVLIHFAGARAEACHTPAAQWSDTVNEATSWSRTSVSPISTLVSTRST